MAAQVGLGLVLFDIKAVGFGPNFPVEVANVVAGRVFAVLDELDAVAEDRAAVHAGDEAFDDVPRPQVQAGDLGNRLGMQKAAGVVFFYCHGGVSGGAISRVQPRLASEREFDEPARSRSRLVDVTIHDAKIFLKRSSRDSSLSLLGVSSISFLTTTSGVMPSEAAVKLVRMRCRSTG